MPEETAVTQDAVPLEHVVALASRLSTLDKVRLVERVAATLERDMTGPQKAPSRSLLGIVAHLGSAPSAEEIDEARREAWANFPRDDI